MDFKSLCLYTTPETVQKTHFRIDCLLSRICEIEVREYEICDAATSWKNWSALGCRIYCNANNKAGDLLPLLCIKAKSMFSFVLANKHFCGKQGCIMKIKIEPDMLFCLKLISIHCETNHFALHGDVENNSHNNQSIIMY